MDTVGGHMGTEFTTYLEKKKRMLSPLKFLPIHVYLKALNISVK